RAAMKSCEGLARSLAFAVLAGVGAPEEGEAQQSLFNVPAIATTPSGQLFVQEQINLGPSGESNTTMAVGLPYGLEVGVNAFRAELWPNDATHHGDAADYALMANASLLLEPLPWLHFQLGLQLGAAASPAPNDGSFVAWGWLGTRVHLPENIAIVVV